MKFSVRIADINILVQSKYERIFRDCNDYLVDEQRKYDIKIVTDEAVIRKELERIQKSDKDFHSLKAAEGLLIHRLIAEALPDYNAFLMHGASVAVNDRAYLFSAKSGTGKTTHICKWLENIDDSFVVNGDKTVILLKDNEVFACGTPWCGKEKLGRNAMIPLKSIIMMERSDRNSIEPVSFKTVFPLVLEQTFQPADSRKMRKTLDLMLQVGHLVSFHKFYFDNYQEDSFQVSYSALLNSET